MSINEWLESLPAPKGILQEAQKHGRKNLLNLGIPNNKSERWRLTNTKELEKIFEYKVPERRNNYIPKKNNHYLYQKNSSAISLNLDPRHNPLDGIDFPKGIRSLSSSELDQKLSSDIYKSDSQQNWIALLNNACTERVLALSISGKELPQLELLMESDTDQLMSYRLILFIEKDSNLNLLEIFLGKNNSAINHLSQIYIEKNSSLNHGYIALGESECNLTSNLFIEQKEKSHYALTTVQKNWLYHRLELDIIQKEGDANTNLNGLQIATANNQLETYSTVKFNGPKGELSQLQKSIASDNSHSIFNGAVIVPSIAQQTNAAQLSRNLLLSKKARIDTKPELEIIADDVTCTHGATISQLNDEEIFYLRSRGIDFEKASQLILNGYSQEILNHLPLENKRMSMLRNTINNLN